jgi:WD40 repeat protein
MPSPFDELPVADRRLIDCICTRFEAAWKQGSRPCLEDHLHEVAVSLRPHLLRELLLLDLEYRQRAGDTLLPNDYANRFPEHADLIAEIGQFPSTRIAAPAAGTLPDIPGYEVLREVGQGGMGTVYEAVQDTPHRPVALKVIRPGIASPQLLKRFKREAEILGRLHHAGIAQVYEAGLTRDGQPFYAMELIHGEPLDRYALLHALDVHARLALFARVCDAVQHAHEHGVIHRDLKPANILVDQAGQPRVLDFGVARLAAIDLHTTPAKTVAGQLLGTPGYMSPEQFMANPAALDARSDIYTLGVILFELLADRLPYDLEHLPLLEVARVIREQEPAHLGSVNALFRGDVETIVAKALAKDPARRYASARELAADIRRYLSYEPILARPPSVLYQFRKFARRNKALVGGVAGILAALVLGLVGTTLFALRARDSARQAKDEGRVARYQTYRARVAAAAAALQVHDAVDAARQLEEAPEELRGWEWYHLHSRLDDRSGRIVAEPGASLFLLHLPDGIQVGQLLPNSSLRLTDLGGHQVRTIAFNAKAGPIGTVLQTRGGLRILNWRKDQGLRLWDEAAAPRFRLTSPKLPRLSPDASRLAVPEPTGQADRVDLALYETASGQRTALCVAHKAQIWAVAFSPDGTRVASADDAGLVCIWNAATGAQIAPCIGHTRKVLSAAFRPDGARLVTASADGTVRQWDPATGRPLEPTFGPHSGDVLSAAYSPDGEWVVSGGTDRTIRVWRASERQEVAVLHGHTGPVTEVAFTPDGRRLASLSQDRGLGWAGDNTVGVWDVDPQASLPVLRGHSSYVYPVAYSPDGQWIASGSWDGTIRLWDARTGEVCGRPLRPRSIVRALAFSPDSSWLVSGCDGQNQMTIWDVATGRVLRAIAGPGKLLQAILVSPDGARIAAVDREQGRGIIVDAATGREIASFRAGQVFNRKALAYSPDGRWLAGVGEDRKTVCLWDADTLQPAAQWTGHSADIQSVAFSPDGRRLVSASSDRTVRVWDVNSGECLGRPLVHPGEVFTAVFHPGSTRIASAGRDGTIWLWDVATHEETVRLTGHTSYVFSLAFSPDGKALVSGSGDGTVRLWDTVPLARRYQARREAEALRPEAERLVRRLFAELREPPQVVSRLRTDASLSAALRRAALLEVRRQGSK